MKNKSPFLACLLILAIIIFAASCGGGGGGGGSVVAFGNNSGPHNGGDAGGWGNGGYNGNGFGGNGGGIGSGNEGEIVITGSTPLNVTKYVYNGTEYSDVKALTTALKASGNLPDSFNVDFYVDGESTPRTARVTANGQANNGQDIFIEHQYKALFPADSGTQEVLFYKRDGITLPGDPAGTEENGFTFETNWIIGSSHYPCGSTIGVAASGDVDFSNASQEIAPYGFKEDNGDYILGFSSSATGTIAINTNKVIKQVDLTSGSSMNLDFTGVTFKNNMINSSSFIGTASNLAGITLPSGLTAIGDSAFKDCSNLATVNLSGNALTSIGNEAFSGCSSLGSFTMPNSVASIGEEAFRDCSDLATLTLSNHLTEIPYGAFLGCANLETVTFSSPSTLSTISANAFYGCSISSIELPNGVTTIERDAFYHCSNLASITIPASVTTMGSAGPSTPFSGTCGSNVSGGCTLIFKGANSFSGDAILPGSAYKVVLKGGVPTKNGTSIFSNDTNLTSVSYEGGSNLIANAFMGCSLLTTVTFKSYPTVIQTTPLPGNVRNIIFEPDLNPMTNLANVGNLFPSTMNYSLLTVTFKNDSSSPHITIEQNAFNFGGANNIRYEFAAHPNNNITYDDGNCFLSTARTTFSATNFTWDSTNKRWQP